MYPPRHKHRVRRSHARLVNRRCTSELGTHACALFREFEWGLPVRSHAGNHKLLVKPCKKVNRPISTPRLNTLLCVHLVPINLVVFQGSDWEISSWGRFRAYMLSALILSEHSYPTMPLAEQSVHQRFVHSGPLVLGVTPRKFPYAHTR